MDAFVSCEEAAELMGVPETLVRQLVATKELPYVVNDRFVRIPTAAIDTYLWRTAN